MQMPLRLWLKVSALESLYLSRSREEDTWRTNPIDAASATKQKTRDASHFTYQVRSCLKRIWLIGFYTFVHKFISLEAVVMPYYYI